MRPSSQSLRDFGQYQRMLMLVFFIVSGPYFAIARYAEAPIFTVNSHGSFILQFSAEMWVAPVFFGSAVHLVAQVVNGDHRLQPWITPFFRMVSALVVGVNRLAYSYGGSFAEVFAPDFAYSLVGGILCMWFALLGWQDMRRGLYVMREVRNGSRAGH